MRYGITGLAAEVAGAAGAAGVAGSDQCFGRFFWETFSPTCCGRMPTITHSGPTALARATTMAAMRPRTTIAMGYGCGYGGLSDIYGCSRSGYSRHAGQTSHNAAQADQIPADVTQSCGEFAPGVTSFPVDRVQEAIQPSSQSAALNDLATASSKASSVVAASCPGEPPLTPLARLDAVEKRLDAMIQAVQIVRPTLARLYDSLSDEQRQRLDALGAEESHNGGATAAAGPTGAGTLSTLCDRQAASFTKLPRRGNCPTEGRAADRV